MTASTKMIERVEFDELPPFDELQAWQTWMRAHGIDPRDVPIGDSFVEVDGRVIRYTAAVRVDGRMIKAPDGGDWPMTEIRECQVYGRRPAPFPDGAVVAHS